MKTYSIASVVCILSALSAPTFGQEPTPPENYGLVQARASLARMTTAPGLNVSLFAAEPMVQNPTSLDIDAKGRIWVTEAANYRKYSNPPIRPEGDRIMVLEDVRGTGEADTGTVFYQDPSINAALGIAVLGDDVLVSASPHVFVLRDTDGDGKADQRLLLLTGTSGQQHDHALHSFVHCADGRVLFNFGNACREIRLPSEGLRQLPLHGPVPAGRIPAESAVAVDRNGRELVGNRSPFQHGMVLSAEYHDGRLTDFEVVGSNFRNNYEAAPDSFGNIWQSDNDDDGNRGVRINYVMEHGNYGYADELTGASWQMKRPNIENEIPRKHWHQNDPGVVPNLLQTGAGSPTGILVNEGAGLGTVFQNKLIHCDAGPRVVRAYPVTKSGAGYQAGVVDILTSSDSWFRPSDVAIHPDGSLFIADWYDANVGGHGMSDNAARFLRGRIYRVARDPRPAAVPAWERTTAPGALAGLRSPNKATQYQAFRALLGMGEAAVPALREAVDHGESRFRARALAVLVRNPAAALPALGRALGDLDADIVVTGIRLAGGLKRLADSGHDARNEKLGELTGELLAHQDPQVRRQLAVSMYGQPGRAKAWAKLAAQHDGADRWYLEALGIGAAGADRECFAAWLSEVNGNRNTLGGRDIVWRLRTPNTAPYLANLLKAEPGQMRYMRAFDFLPESAERTEALLELARANPSLPVLTESLQRLFRTAARDLLELQEILSRALNRSQGQPAFVDLLAAAGVGAHADELLKTAAVLGNAPEALEAVELLMRTPSGVAKMRTTLRNSSVAEADALVRILGSLGREAAMDILTGEILVSGPVEQRSLAVRALARTQAGAARLVALAKEGRYPAELRGAGAAALAMVQYASLKQDIEDHFPQPVAKDGKALPPIQELAKMSGDPARGRLLFESPGSSCVICHRIGEVGVDFGPGLGAIGAKLPKEALFEAILNPNAGISMGFETSEVRLRGGVEALGIVRSETEDELILVLPGGALQRVAKSEIKGTRKLPTSMMPSGTNQSLSQKDLVDLVEYLTAQRAAK